jgi:hypothetical protein
MASIAYCARSCTLRLRSSSDGGSSAVAAASGSSAFVSARAVRSSSAGSGAGGAAGAGASRCRLRADRTSAASPSTPAIHANLLRTRRCYPVAASCLASRFPFPESPAGEAA